MSSLAILCNFFSWRLNWGVIKWSDGISGPAGQKHQKPVGERWKRTRVRRHWGRRFGINAGTLSSLRRPLRRRHYYLDKWDNWAECRCSAGALLSAGSSAPPVSRLCDPRRLIRPSDVAITASLQIKPTHLFICKFFYSTSKKKY